MCDTNTTMDGISPVPGDVIWVDRGAYRHCGIYEGGGRVIHFAAKKGSETSAENAVVHSVSLEDFQRGCPLKIIKFPGGFSPEETLRRAYQRIGEKGYDLFTNNCDHFATWCKTGEHRSLQVDDAKTKIRAAAEKLGGERGSAFADIVCSLHDFAQDFKAPHIESKQERIQIGKELNAANELNSSISETFILPQGGIEEFIAEEIPEDAALHDDEYPELEKYVDAENDGAAGSGGVGSGGSGGGWGGGGGSGGGYSGREGISENRKSKVGAIIDSLSGKLKGVAYSVSGALEMWKPRMPALLRKIPYRAIGAKVANVIDKAAIAIKVFFKILTPAQGREEMHVVDTALLGQTVREKSLVPVKERVETVFGKTGASLRQIVHGVLDRILPKPLRQAIAGGIKKVGRVIASGITKAAQKVGGLFQKIKNAIFT